MSHQVRLRTERLPRLTGLSLDAAREAALRLSSEYPGEWLVERVEGFDKIARSIAFYDLLYWAEPCTGYEDRLFGHRYCTKCSGMGVKILRTDEYGVPR